MNEIEPHLTNFNCDDCLLACLMITHMLLQPPSQPPPARQLASDETLADDAVPNQPRTSSDVATIDQVSTAFIHSSIPLVIIIHSYTPLSDNHECFSFAL